MWREPTVRSSSRRRSGENRVDGSRDLPSDLLVFMPLHHPWNGTADSSLTEQWYQSHEILD